MADSNLASSARAGALRASRQLPRSIFRHLRTAAGSAVRNRGLFAIDLSLSAVSVAIAAVLRFGPELFVSNAKAAKALVALTALFVVICMVIFPLAGVYKRKWRYASIPDYIALVQAILIASLSLTTCVFFYSGFSIIPHSIVAIQFMALTSLLALVRLAFRQEDLKVLAPGPHAASFRFDELVPVLLVGPGPEADLYLRALQRDSSAPYHPVGFLDEAPADVGTVLHGVPVLGSTEELEAVVAELTARSQRPRHLIFTAPVSSFAPSVVERLTEQSERMGVPVSRLNSPIELQHADKANLLQLRPIELTDLLQRPQNTLDILALQRFIRNRRVLVTGAGGSIGSELARQIAALSPSHMVVIDNSEFNLYSIDLDLAENFPNLGRTAQLCDVRDTRRLNLLFEQHRPELVFHAAALKHVPMVELNPCEGVLTNVCGTMNVAEAVRRWGAACMVQISTDKVVNSPNVMGATKRLAELYCQALDLDCASKAGGSRFVTVRFGNVLGSSGSLIPLFKRQLARGGPLTVTHPEMKRFFMTIREAAELTLQASAYALERKLGSGQIFVLDMGEPIKIIDIARRMIRLAGFIPEKDIKIQIVGCRPGEKLFEELFDRNEKRVAPPVPGVFGAVPTPIPLPVLSDVFQRLNRHAAEGDEAAVLETMCVVLPEFRHSHARLQAGSAKRGLAVR